MVTPKQIEEMNQYINSQDNESGSFLSRDLIKIRKKSYEAGYKAAMGKAKVLEDALDWYAQTGDGAYSQAHLYLRLGNLQLGFFTSPLTKF